MKRASKILVMAMAALLGASGCVGRTVGGVEVKPPPEEPRKEGMFGPNGLNILDVQNMNRRGAVETLGVNSYLWRASLDILRDYPLAAADPLGGLISTDWLQPASAPGERVKATAHVRGADLSANSLAVTVSRQTRGAMGDWVEAPVAPDTAARLEAAILEQARRIRIAEAGG